MVRATGAAGGWTIVCGGGCWARTKGAARTATAKTDQRCIVNLLQFLAFSPKRYRLRREMRAKASIPIQQTLYAAQYAGLQHPFALRREKCFNLVIETGVLRYKRG